MATDVRNQGATFSKTNTKLYGSVVVLSTQDNGKLLEQLRSGFKKTINCNKYETKASTERPNQCLNKLIDPRFQGANKLLFYHLKLMHTEQITSNIFFWL